MERLLRERASARSAGDFATADAALSEILRDHGVIVYDAARTWRAGTKKEVRKRMGATRDLSRHRDEYAAAAEGGPRTSSLSEEEIRSAIGARRRAQLGRDFVRADRIRSELRAAGVYLEDGRKEWRADGIPFVQRVAQRGPVGSAARAGARPPLPIVRSAHSSAASDERDVADLLAQRAVCRAAGDYGRSDEIRDRLYEKYDVRIDDGLGEWSAGGRFGEGRALWAGDDALAYVESSASATLPPDAAAYVARKVAERARAKRTRNYPLSDAIRDELFNKYGVTIHDKINEWSAGGEFGPGESWNHVPVEADRAEGVATGSGRFAGWKRRGRGEHEEESPDDDGGGDYNDAEAADAETAEGDDDGTTDALEGAAWAALGAGDGEGTPQSSNDDIGD